MFFEFQRITQLISITFDDNFRDGIDNANLIFIDSNNSVSNSLLLTEKYSNIEENTENGSKLYKLKVCLNCKVRFFQVFIFFLF